MTVREAERWLDRQQVPWGLLCRLSAALSAAGRSGFWTAMGLFGGWAVLRTRVEP